MALPSIILFVTYFVPGVLLPVVGRVWAADPLVFFAICVGTFQRNHENVALRTKYNLCLVVPFLCLLVWLSIITLVMLFVSNAPPISVMSSLAGRFRPLFYMVALRPYFLTEAGLRTLLRTMTLIFILQLIVVLAQGFDVAGINTWYTPRFRAQAVDDISYIYLSGTRTIGTIGNPNALGTFLAIFGSYGLCSGLFHNGRRPVAAGWILYVTALIAAIFFAKTRQGTLTLLLVTVLASAYATLHRKLTRTAMLLMISAIAIPIVGYLLLADTNLSERFAIFTQGRSLLSEASLRTRFELWPEFFSTYRVTLIFGNGLGELLNPQSDVIWDSGWLLVLQIGGIPLACLYFWWLAKTPFYGLQYILAIPRPQSRSLALAMAVLCVLILIVVTEIVNPGLNSTLLLLPIIILYGSFLASTEFDTPKLGRFRRVVRPAFWM